MLSQAANPLRGSLKNEGCSIERFYAWRGTKEPFEKHSLEMQTAKLLIQKVAAIHYTLGRYQSSPDTVVIWADTDVVMLRPFDDLFVDFVTRYDVTYVPFTGPGRWSPAFTGNGFLEDGWRIESGMMTFLPNERSLAFTAAALEMYEGGMLRLLPHLLQWYHRQQRRYRVTRRSQQWTLHMCLQSTSGDWLRTQGM